MLPILLVLYLPKKNQFQQPATNTTATATTAVASAAAAAAAATHKAVNCKPRILL